MNGITHTFAFLSSKIFSFSKSLGCNFSFFKKNFRKRQNFKYFFRKQWLHHTLPCNGLPPPTPSFSHDSGQANENQYIHTFATNIAEK